MKLNTQAPAVVLVEMDEVTLELYQRELSKSFTVFGFVETDEVIQTITNRDIRAVVIEPEIQDGKGWDLIDAINRRFPGRCIPIVVCSTREARSGPAGLQVAKYLTKPVLPKALRENTLEVIQVGPKYRER